LCPHIVTAEAVRSAGERAARLTGQFAEVTYPGEGCGKFRSVK
jgi:hypothetical protein